MNAQDVHLDWATQISGAGGSIVTSSMTIDEEDHIFATGIFLDSIEVPTLNGQVKLVSAGATDMFVTKINQDGQIIWIKAVGGKGEMGSKGTTSSTEDLYREPFFSIVSDLAGNLYITGYYKDSVDFDPGPGRQMRGSSPGNFPNSFILSLSSDGEFRWVKTLYGANNGSNEIAINKNTNELYITGFFTDKVDFDDGTGIHIVSPTIVTRGAQDIFIAKYDTDGNFIWAKPIGNGARPGTSEGLGIHVGLDGNVYTTGLYRDSLFFDPNLPNAYIKSPQSNSNVFVLKTDADGRYIWARDMGGFAGSGNCGGSAIVTDSDGNVYTTGYFQGAATFDPQNRTPVPAIYGNGITFFLSKLDSAGNYEWAKIFERPPGKNSADNGFGVAVDDEDNIYACGYWGSEIYLDPDFNKPNRELFTATNGSNSLFIKLDPDGNYIWGKHFNTPRLGHNRALNMLVKSGKVFLSGYFSDTTDFNPSGSPYNLFSENSYDGYIAKLSCPADKYQVTIEECGEVYELNGVEYAKSGSYIQNFKNHLGCDSIVHLELTLKPMDEVHITIEEFVLSTTIQFKSYQWILNGTPIPGANNSKYEVKENGQYQVAVISENGCTDTSDVYEVTNATGIKDNRSIEDILKIYPNPFKDEIHITTANIVDVVMTNIEGKEVKTIKNATVIFTRELAEGIYFLRVYGRDGSWIKTEKIIKIK